MANNPKKVALVLGVMLLFIVILGVLKGAVNIPFDSIFSAENRAILDMRILRILTAILAGGGLAVCGIALQAILRNPLAEPYLLGTSSGAGLATVTAIILGTSTAYLPLAAFAGAIASIILVYNFAGEEGRIFDKTLILSGVIVSIIFSALIVFLVSLFPEKAFHEMTWWLWGSLAVYDYRLVLLVSLPVLSGVIAIYLFSQDLNAISLGEEEATHLGINAQNVKKILILLTALITASLLCISGVIGFVGLIVPHIMRMFCGSNHKTLIPLSFLAAAVFLVGSDLISRLLFAPVEIPIGVITAVIGAPVFVILLKKGKKS